MVKYAIIVSSHRLVSSFLERFPGRPAFSLGILLLSGSLWGGWLWRKAATRACGSSKMALV